MRKMIIAGNWKMNKTLSESVELAKSINDSDKVGVMIAPNYTALAAVKELIKDKKICLAAQNMHYEEEGAFTGEVSPNMLKDIGCGHVILGHSERRHVFMEDDAVIREKVLSALAHDIKVVLCIGEKLEQRETGKTNEILEMQLKEGLKGVEKLDNVIIAYEPVWAIGTGKVATVEQVQETHAYVRSVIESMYDPEVASAMRILYGGSLKPENAPELLALEDVDGGLIGGAALKAESFNELISIGENNS